MRVGYYLPFGPKPLTPGVVVDEATGTLFQRWFRQSSTAVGARVGVIHSLTTSGPGEATATPIDERFYTAGATTVRSSAQRDPGPHANDSHSCGGAKFTSFHVENSSP